MKIETLKKSKNTSQVTFLLKLQSPEILWKNLKSETRTRIRKSLRHDLKFKEGNVKDFYPLYQRLMKKRGSPPHGCKFFEEIIKEFQGKAKVFIADYQGVPAAGMIMLPFEDKMVNFWAASNYKYAYMRPNNFLYWEVIKWAYKEGYMYFDFGRSPKGSGTYKFKQYWGAEEIPFEHYYSPSGRQLVSSKTQSKWLSMMWKLLPFPIANWLGPILRKYIS